MHRGGLNYPGSKPRSRNEANTMNLTDGKLKFLEEEKACQEQLGKKLGALAGELSEVAPTVGEEMRFMAVNGEALSRNAASGERDGRKKHTMLLPTVSLARSREKAPAAVNYSKIDSRRRQIYVNVRSGIVEAYKV